MSCRRTYPIIDGILVFLQGEPLDQEEERRFWDALAAEHVRSDRRTLLEVVARHHCIPIMRRQSGKFREQFKPHEWILDVGVGYGWHWTGQGVGAQIIGVDISLGNLMLARRLQSDSDGSVVLVCADAVALPIRENSISGIWSVQTFQHFPQRVLTRVQSELNRVLRNEFVMEIYNLNPARLHKVIYRFFGKQFHCRGKLGVMELNRLSAEEWANVWRWFRGGHPCVTRGYSELFFHPDFHLRPWPYPLWLEHALVTCTPKLAALFARQVHVRIGTREEE